MYIEYIIACYIVSPYTIVYCIAIDYIITNINIIMLSYRRMVYYVTTHYIMISMLCTDTTLHL